MVSEPLPEQFLEELVDHVMAILPPYETSVYLYLIRRSRCEGSRTVRIGKRTIGEGVGKGTRSQRGGNYQHITAKIQNLANAGFVTIGDTDRSGTLYSVSLPSEVPAVRERMAVSQPEASANHYRDPALRKELFERDSWRCRYCGEVVTPETATIDHIQPVSAEGSDDPANLATACMMCNSIKSGRTYADAAADLLEAVKARAQRS